MIRRELLLFLLFTFSYFNTHAELLSAPDSSSGCTSARLDGPKGPFAKIPKYDQLRLLKTESALPSDARIADSPESKPGTTPDTNICYAVVDSILIDAKRFSQGDKLEKLTSPLSIALNHKSGHRRLSDEERQRFLSGDENFDVIGPGNPVTALLSNQNQRVCDQRWLDLQPLKLAGSGRINRSKDKFPNDAEVETRSRNAYQLESGLRATELLPKNERSLDSQTPRPQTDLRALSPANAIPLKAAIEDENPIQQMQMIMTDSCRDHSFPLELTEPNFSTGKDSRADIAIEADLKRAAEQNDFKGYIATSLKLKRAQLIRLKAQINSLLVTKNAKPIGIGYCHRITSGTPSSECNVADHASVIVGQRWIAGSCQYLIRDSYGEERCKKSSYPCENGSMWIPRDDLLDHTRNGRIFWLP